MERKWAHTHTHTHAMELSIGAEQFVVFPSRFSFAVPGRSARPQPAAARAPCWAARCWSCRTVAPGAGAAGAGGGQVARPQWLQGVSPDSGGM